MSKMNTETGRTVPEINRACANDERVRMGVTMVDAAVAVKRFAERLNQLNKQLTNEQRYEVFGWRYAVNGDGAVYVNDSGMPLMTTAAPTPSGEDDLRVTDPDAPAGEEGGGGE